MESRAHLVMACAAALVALAPVTAAAQERFPTIDVASDRYLLAIGVVEQADFNGHAANEVISQYEFDLRLRLKSQAARDVTGLTEVHIPYWVHTGGDEDRLIGREVLLVLDLEDDNAVVRALFDQRVFCMDEEDIEAQNWLEVPDVGEMGPGCIDYSGDNWE